jgi:hypothetical protein
MNRELIEEAGLLRTSDNSKSSGWERVWPGVGLLKYIPLYFLVFPLCFGLISLWYINETPTYTAEAVIGPPGPSPVASMLVNGGGALGLVNRALGSGGGGGHDPYADYLQLLHSSRLSQAIMARDDIVKKMFAARWDEENSKWREPAFLGRMSLQLRQYLGRPASIEPGIDDVTLYLAAHLRLEYAGGGPSLSLFPTSTPFVTLTFTYDNDPQVAEEILNLILSEADRLIRDDERRTITARISYLRGRLTQQATTDERMALIGILSNQEQLLTMIQADQRYAGTLLVPPHASVVPTWPPRLRTVAVMIVIASVALWLGLALLIHWFRHARRQTKRFEEGRRPRPLAVASE